MARDGYGRPKVEHHHALDVRKLHRHGLLRAGKGTWFWSRNGQPTGAVAFIIEHSTMLLIFRSEIGAATEQRMIEQRIPLAFTPCHFGGRRPWFRCRCGRRVAILFGFGAVFACRMCGGLVYASQSEGCRERAIRRALNIRERLGSDPDLISPFPDKPLGMHWRTYDRLRAAALGAERQSTALLAAKMRRLWPDEA